MPDLPYRHALIVGAGSGLSASIARAFAAAGLTIALAARSVEDLADLSHEIGARSLSCDAAKPGDVAHLFGALDSAGATPDVVVYNASYRTRGPFAELDAAEVEKSLAVTAYGGFSRRASRRPAHAQGRPRRHPVHRRLGEHQGLCRIRAVRDGQIRPPRPRAIDGA